MDVSLLVVQFPVSCNVDENLKIILEILNQSKEDDMVIFPEGSISGYDTDMSFLEKIETVKVNSAIEVIKKEALKRKIHIWAGACLLEQEKWYNTALGFSPQGQRFRYNKVNLATHERGMFAFGSELTTFPLKFKNQKVNVGVQLCRDLKYPEQWRWLAMNNAQIFLHLNNTEGDLSEQPIWKSQLISRATENQRFVVSVNTASKQQKCPTIVIDPAGRILKEVSSDKMEYFRITIDLDLISDWYIKQSRTDLIRIKYSEK